MISVEWSEILLRSMAFCRMFSCAIRTAAATQSLMLGLPKIEWHSLWFGLPHATGTRLCSGFGDTSDIQEASIGEAEVVA